jgi:hypothetical protein
MSGLKKLLARIRQLEAERDRAATEWAAFISEAELLNSSLRAELARKTEALQHIVDVGGHPSRPIARAALSPPDNTDGPACPVCVDGECTGKEGCYDEAAFP